METALDYLEKTASAAKILFDGIDSYLRILSGHRKSIFVSGASDPKDIQREYALWAKENQEDIQRWQTAYLQYSAEEFAQATLCGAVLQLACKAIEVYSSNTTVPEAWREIITKDSKAQKFAFGRVVRGVPLGLVVYAGRNQHMHYEDRSFREPTPTIFDTLARNIPGAKAMDVRDPALDLTNPRVGSFASNTTYILEWRSYGEYFNDMRELLTP